VASNNDTVFVEVLVAF